MAASWVWGALQSRKILVDDAVGLLRRIPLGIERNLASANRFRSEQVAARLEMVREWRQRHSDEIRRPWRAFPQIAEWAAQYSLVKDRYRFLVLDGPSRMGKTAYVRAMAEGAGAGYLEINLAGKAALDMTAYRCWEHEYLCFDEAHPEQIIQRKNLFQASVMPVQLQTSATNCHAMSVYVGAKKLICCSNIWGAALSRMSLDDAA